MIAFAHTQGQSADQDEKVATLERQLQEAMSVIQEQSARIEELIEELKEKDKFEVSVIVVQPCPVLLSSYWPFGSKKRAYSLRASPFLTVMLAGKPNLCTGSANGSRGTVNNP